MPGTTITDQQYGLYMSARRLGATQKVAGAKAGLCERTGRTLEKQKCKPSQQPKRGRKPGNHTFFDVWDNVIVPLIKENPFLSGTILLGPVSKASVYDSVTKTFS